MGHWNTWKVPPTAVGLEKWKNAFHYSDKRDSDTYIRDEKYRDHHEADLRTGEFRLQYVAEGIDKPFTSLTAVSNAVKKSANPYALISVAYSTAHGVTYDHQPRFDPAVKPRTDAAAETPFQKRLRKTAREHKKATGLTHPLMQNNYARGVTKDWVR